MGRSRKNRSRKEIRRRRQLKEEGERIASSVKRDTVDEEISYRFNLKQHAIELVFVALMVSGVVFIISLGPDKKAAQELRESFDPILYNHSLAWDEEFSGGYKVIVLTDTDIIHTSFDSLPKDLKINWKKMTVARIEANQLNSTIEKIKIAVNDISYAPANVSGLAVTVTLSRQKGASGRLINLGNHDFIVRIVEDDGQQLFCLLGLKKL